MVYTIMLSQQHMSMVTIQVREIRPTRFFTRRTVLDSRCKCAQCARNTLILKWSDARPQCTVFVGDRCERIPHWGIVFELEFIETSGFSAVRDKYFSDVQFHLLQLFLMANPGAGSVIRGSGGVRKVRWGVEGRGKRGGLRVIYYWIAGDDQIFLITVYRKSEVSDLSNTAIKQIRKLIRELR